MSRYLETSVYSLDSNSIFDVALKFERLGLQEINKNSEIIYQGQDTTDSSLRDATSFKVAFDKLFSLYKEFYIKVVKGSQVLDDAIESELEEKFEADLINKKDETSVQTAINNYLETIEIPAGTPDEQNTSASNLMDNIFKKVSKISTQKTDNNLTKYAKLDMIDEALSVLEDFIEEDEDIKIINFENRKDKILDKLAEARETRKKLVINEYKQNTDTREKMDNNLTLRLASFEGTASNVLRDLISVSNNLVGDINTKRLNLQNGFINNEKLADSVLNDFSKITDYNKELKNASETKKNYKETYNKVQQNLTNIQVFINEIKSGYGLKTKNIIL
jgi:hypothetical protein